MALSDWIVPKARTLFPPSAGKLVLVESAWHPQRSTLSRPSPTGSDGWAHVAEYATRDVLLRLQNQGFTHVGLTTRGTKRRSQPTQIAWLLT